MPVPHLGQTSIRLLLSSSVVAASALCPIIGASVVTTTAAAAVASVAGGVLANDVGEHLKLAHRLREKKNSLRNHDLTKAVGSAISIVLFAVAEEHKARKNDWHKDFENLAKAAPNYWKNIADNRQDDFAGIWEENLPAELFSTKASEFATVKALDENSWIEFLQGLCAENKVGLGDVLILNTAQKWESIFPKALREVLKDDFEHGGKAFASLTLSMMSEISAGIKENQTAILQLLQNQGIAQPNQEYNEILSRLDALANQQTITPEIKNALKQVSTQIESGFEEVLREMGVQYEEIRKEIETLRNEILDALSNISSRKEDQDRHIEIVEGNQKILEAVVKITPANLANLDHAYPSITDWVGRAGELQTVGEYLANSNIALIKIIGVGGIGKSTLAAKVFEVEGSKFEGKFWWDLTISPNFTEFVRNALRHLGRFSLQDIQQIPEKDVIDRLVNLLQKQAFLIVIDNLETVLKSGWEGSLWEKFFCRWLGCAGKSKIIVTSQDVPNLTELKGKTLHLEEGLNCTEGATLLRNLGVLGETRELEDFVESVGGYPLYLMLVAGLLVTEEEDDPQIKYLSRYGNLYEIKGIHRGKNSVSVKDVFEESFGRLSDQQKQLLLNLSVYRLPFESAAALVMYEGTESEAENDLKLLAKRCFLLKGKDASGFKFQPVVLAYLKSKAGDLTEVHRKAIEYYGSVQESEGWKTKEDVSGYIEICYHLGELGERRAAFDTIGICDEFLNFQGFYDVLIEVYELIVQNWQPKDEDEERLFAAYLNNLGSAYNSLGQYQKAIEYHEKSLKIREKIGNQPDIARSLNNLGNTYNYLEKHEKAIEYCEKSLNIWNQLNNHQEIADTLNNLGNAYHSLGQYETAIKYHKKSLEIREEIGPQQDIAKSFINLGIAYYSLGKYETAIEYLKKSLTINRRIGHQQQIALSLNNLGSAYDSLERYETAIEYYKESLEIRQKICNQQEIAHSLHNLGLAYRSYEEYQKAIECFEKLLEIKRPTNDKEGEAKCLQILAGLYHQTGQFKKGYAAGYQASQILQESNLPLDSLYPKWLQSIIKFAQKGKGQFVLCFITGLFAFPFALVWIIVVMLWRIIRAKINRPR
ncbi:tetratricopeptide repeat protein [Ancylothrix sp. C2]|uniref:tetratricopeptide repeat protein n=1 Tax=Ancylothrix sp. D3o TaxID=2953691 RepID=UPI0021BA8BA3|nr:tetratricopeptide repeat protein [Ancylothrix sp. D3o]MCT7950429.1 tetratricopeptide repeat protein [Ancylothrix sp. D3o]